MLLNIFLLYYLFLCMIFKGTDQKIIKTDLKKEENRRMIPNQKNLQQKSANPKNRNIFLDKLQNRRMERQYAQSPVKYVISAEDTGFCQVKCRKYTGGAISTNGQLMYLECPVRTRGRKDIFYNKQNIANVQNLYSQFRHSCGKFPYHKENDNCNMYKLEEKIMKQLYDKLKSWETDICKKNPEAPDEKIETERENGENLRKKRSYMNGIVVECVPGTRSNIDLSRGIHQLQIPQSPVGRTKLDVTHLESIDSFYVCPIRNVGKTRKIKTVLAPFRGNREQNMQNPMASRNFPMAARNFPMETKNFPMESRNFPMARKGPYKDLQKRMRDSIENVILCPIRHKRFSKKGKFKAFLNRRHCLSCPIRHRYDSEVRNRNIFQDALEPSEGPIVCPVKTRSYLQFLEKNNDNLLSCRAIDLRNYDFRTAPKRDCQDMINLLIKLIEKECLNGEGPSNVDASGFKDNDEEEPVSENEEQKNEEEQQEEGSEKGEAKPVAMNGENEDNDECDDEEPENEDECETEEKGEAKTEDPCRKAKSDSECLQKNSLKKSKNRHSNSNANNNMKQSKNSKQQQQEQKSEEQAENGKSQKHHEPIFETKEEKLLRDINENLVKSYHEISVAQWEFETNITSETKRRLLEVSQNYSTEMKVNSRMLRDIKSNIVKCSMDYSMKRQYELLRHIIWDSELPDDEASEMQQVLNEMESIYSTARVAETEMGRNRKELRLEPDIEKIFATSRDPKYLLYIWSSWRDNTGRKIKPLFQKYVSLLNDAAKFNGYASASAALLQPYEDPNLISKVESLWKEVEPLYLQLHAYVRKKLYSYYNNGHVDRKGPLPAHLMGNLWAQSWVNIYNITQPFPEVELPSITSMLVEKEYTPVKMFVEAENFFRSMGLPQMPPKFWERSVFEQKDGVEMVCHASAWDMYDDEDFRIKMCTQVDFEDFITIHHEMGHIEYSMLYKNLPVVFREGANPGFHEAIGDVIGLSVSSITHMRRLHLLKRKSHKQLHEVPRKVITEEDINFLYWIALQKLAFIPYSLVVSEFQYSTYDGRIDQNKYNNYWWKLRNKYQGIVSPVKRNEEDFDPGAKFHIAAGVEYLRYFIAHIIQFQFHEALCNEAGFRKDPLHKCDIYGHQQAGDLLKRMLQMGHSKPWPNAMRAILKNTDEMSSKSIMNYFRPLYAWLQMENERTGEKIGWK